MSRIPPTSIFYGRTTRVFGAKANNAYVSSPFATQSSSSSPAADAVVRATETTSSSSSPAADAVVRATETTSSSSSSPAADAVGVEEVEIEEGEGDATSSLKLDNS